MSKIPKTFSLGAIKYKVEEKRLDQNFLGFHVRDKALIELNTHLGQEIIQDQIKEATYYHELAHAFMSYINREDLNGDEAFIDNLGKCLHNYITTVK